MARRKDLAGLAALGALGMLLSQKQDGSRVSVEDRGSSPEVSPSRDTRDYGVDYSEAPQRGRDFMTEAEPGWTSATAPVRRPASGGRTPASGVNLGTSNAGYDSTAMRPASRMRDDQYNPDVKQRLREDQYNPDVKQRRLNSAEAMAQLDRQLGVRQGPTAGNGRSVTGTETSRNISNTLNALYPLGGGVGKIGAELATAGRVQKAYNQAQAARRAAEGFSPAEAQAAREAAELAARDAKVLNPNAWLAGPQGMKNFKKGGQVKKSAAKVAVKASASRRGDGIAQRGKTRGKMV